MSIKINSLSLIYKGIVQQSIFDNVNIEAEKNKIIGIIGPSGVGKSSLLNLLGGLLRPTMGNIIYDGFDIANSGEKEVTIFRRDNIGYVFQNYRLFANLTVKRNVEIPMELKSMKKDRIEKRMIRLLTDVGMTDFEKVFPKTLSGGQQQRIAIASALANDPEYILCDEPTGNLDTENSIKIFELLEKMVHQYKKTMFICTHDQNIIDKVDIVWKIDGRNIVM